MGDMADMAIDHILDDYEHWEEHKDAPLAELYEEGLISEYGVPVEPE